MADLSADSPLGLNFTRIAEVMYADGVLEAPTTQCFIEWLGRAVGQLVPVEDIDEAIADMVEEGPDNALRVEGAEPDLKLVVPLSNSTPEPVGPSGHPGVSTEVSRADHAHAITPDGISTLPEFIRDTVADTLVDGVATRVEVDDVEDIISINITDIADVPNATPYISVIVDAAVALEESARIAADATLQGNINAEASARAAADALLAPLASPALTGNPTAPTPSPGDNDTSIATTAFVQGAVLAGIGANDAMIFKGVIDCSTNPNYPAADAGHTYRVSVAGKIGGAAGVNVEVGDLLICMTDGTASGNQIAVGGAWGIYQANLDGAVIGPPSATANNPAVFDGGSGRLIKEVTYAQFKTNAGLNNVDNTSDATKNSAAATLSNKTLAKPVLQGVGAWTTAGWLKGMEVPKGTAIWWPKGASAHAWGIGASDDYLAIGMSTADDASAAASYPLIVYPTVIYSEAALVIDNSYPIVRLTEHDASANNKHWDIYANGETLFMSTLDDLGGGNNFLQVDRTGGVADSLFINTSALVALTAPRFDFYGSLAVIAQSAVGRGVEIASGANYSLIDFHSKDGGASDFDARIVSVGGHASAYGQAALDVTAASFQFNTLPIVTKSSVVADADVAVFDSTAGKIKAGSPAIIRGTISAARKSELHLYDYNGITPFTSASVNRVGLQQMLNDIADTILGNKYCKGIIPALTNTVNSTDPKYNIYNAFEVDGTIYAYSGVILHGQGFGSRIRLANGVNAPLLKLQHSNSSISNATWAHFENLVLDGNWWGNPSLGTLALVDFNTLRLMMKNVAITNAGGVGFKHRMDSYYPDNVTPAGNSPLVDSPFGPESIIDSCIFKWALRECIIHDGPSDAHYSNCTITSGAQRDYASAPSYPAAPAVNTDIPLMRVRKGVKVSTSHFQCDQYASHPDVPEGTASNRLSIRPGYAIYVDDPSVASIGDSSAQIVLDNCHVEGCNKLIYYGTKAVGSSVNNSRLYYCNSAAIEVHSSGHTFSDINIVTPGSGSVIGVVIGSPGESISSIKVDGTIAGTGFTSVYIGATTIDDIDCSELVAWSGAVAAPYNTQKPRVIISDATPILALWDSDGAANEKCAAVYHNGGVLSFYFQNDIVTSSVPWLEVHHAGGINPTTLVWGGTQSNSAFSTTVDSSGVAFCPQAHLMNTNTDASSPYRIFQKLPWDRYGAAADIFGTILWYGKATGGTVYVGSINLQEILTPGGSYIPSAMNFATTYASPGDSSFGLYNGMTIGAPGGGYRGLGTLNAQAVYDDNTLLSCYVFGQALDKVVDLEDWHALVPNREYPERWVEVGDEDEEGKISNVRRELVAPARVEERKHVGLEKFISRIGTEHDPLTLDGYARHWKEKRHLTAFPNKAKYNWAEGLSAGEWVQRLVETAEIQAVLIEKLNEELKVVKGKVGL